MSSHVIAIIGRPNVGKSTLFNALTRQRALVENTPGVTRDRRTGVFQHEDSSFELVDTAGFLDESQDDLQHLMNEQTELAMQVASAIWMVVDCEMGLCELDRVLWLKIKAHGIPVLLLANKADRLTYPEESAVFHGLDASFLLLSSKSKSGFRKLYDWCDQFNQEHPILESDLIKQSMGNISVLGRPNAGKSTFCNLLLGENRMIVSDQAGTTRDAIEVPFLLDGHQLTLIDTAGVRRKSRIKIKLEQQMVWQSLGALKYSAVTLIIIDSTIGLTDQDLRLMQHIWQSGSGMILCLNKWDLIDRDTRTTLLKFTENYTKQWQAPILFTSFKTGLGLGVVKSTILNVLKCFNAKPSSSLLTKIMEDAVIKNPPPLSKRKTQIKLRFAHPIGYQPLRIKITGKMLDDLPSSYKKYILNQYKEALKLTGVSLQINYVTDHNPYAGQSRK